MIKVSVIVPVYNVEKYLNKCLKSLSCQTFRDFEVIIVNDGTPDKCQIIIDKYVKKYPSIFRSFIKSNGGLGDARNYGLKRANGEYVLFVDSDDFVHKTMIEKMYNTAISDDSQMVVCGIYDVYENGNRCREYVNNCIGVTNVFENKQILLNRPSAWNKLYSIELFKDEKMKYVSNKWYEDIRLTLKLYLKCERISYIDASLYYYLIREGSIMNNKNVVRNYEILEAFDDILEYFSKFNMLSVFYDEIEFLAIEHIFISSQVRVINSSNVKEIRKNIQPLINYFYNHFSFSNKYINKLCLNRKIILLLLKSKLFLVVKIIFMLKNLLRKKANK